MNIHIYDSGAKEATGWITTLGCLLFFALAAGWIATRTAYKPGYPARQYGRRRNDISIARLLRVNEGPCYPPHEAVQCPAKEEDEYADMPPLVGEEIHAVADDLYVVDPFSRRVIGVPDYNTLRERSRNLVNERWPRMTVDERTQPAGGKGGTAE
ncbi:hypothetical protein C8R46DRAFT_1049795 [Mycena filopes]|nr:hypothetical protein C8R46DRAFT_1049795 [Mycena filopes]